MSGRLSFILLLITLISFGCGGGPGKSSVTVGGSPNIGGGFSESDGYINMDQKKCGTEFLLQSALAPQMGTGSSISNPTAQGMRSRIVVFEEHGESLVMLEVRDEYQPGDELSAHVLVATFPVIEKKDGLIIFDFNEGMTHVAKSWDWYVSDYNGKQIKKEVALSVEDAYLREVVGNDNALTIVQTISAREGMNLIPLEVYYYLSPYQPNPNYVSVEAPDFKYLGYFEANPLVQEDFASPYTLISRWDITQPVTYYLSHDIPEEYRDAVKEGVLYWNKAYGKEVLKAELAPTDAQAPNFRYNIIQWHSNLSTGAYADAQMDPRTGEILHSQIYIGSSFAEWAKAYRIPRYDRQFEEDEQIESENAEEGSLELGEVTASRLCHLSPPEMFENLYQIRDFVMELPEGRVAAAAEDMVRAVVAHEVGHTLGLRHNFAASTVNRISPEQEMFIFKEYLESGVFPDNMTEPIGSVMEYPTYSVDILIGGLMRRDNQEAFSHDHYAIQWGYFNFDSDPVFEGHPFCTDSQVSSYADCERWDSGDNFVEQAVYDLGEALDKVPWLLSETYLLAKAAYNPRRRGEIVESTPSAAQLAMSVLAEFYRVTSLLKSPIALKSIYDQYPDYTDIDKPLVEEATEDWLNQSIAGSGGIESVLRVIDPAFFQKKVEGYAKKFKQTISKESYQSIDLPEGGTVKFTEDELRYMSDRSKQLFPEVEIDIVARITGALSGAPFKMIDSIERVEELLSKWAIFVLINGEKDSFKYPIEIRRSAAQIYYGSGPLPDWMGEYVADAAREYKPKLEAVLGMPMEDVDLQEIPREERRAIQAELDLYYMLERSSGIPLPIPIEELIEEPTEKPIKGAASYFQQLLE